MDIKNIPETDPNDEFPNIYHEGLWKKSRHPNLFFELVCWVGFAFSGLSEDKISWVGFLGPLFLQFVMLLFTIPITEQHMANTRDNWNAWKKRSNIFWLF